MTRRAVGTVERHQWNASSTSASGRRDSVTNIATCPPSATTRLASSLASCAEVATGSS